MTSELLFEFHHFFMRKLWFAHLGRALVVSPGGFGTLDEMFEFLTLAQTEKLERKIPILLYGPATGGQSSILMLSFTHGAITPQDLSLFSFLESLQEAFEFLKARLPLHPEPTTPAFAKSRTHPKPADSSQR